MQAPEATFPVYADAHGEHWRPADHTDYGRNWLRCVETDRGARYLPSVEREFGPLTAEAARASTDPVPTCKICGHSSNWHRASNSMRCDMCPDRMCRVAPVAAGDPDALMVAGVLTASDRPMTAELLLSAAKAYAALRSSRERTP